MCWQTERKHRFGHPLLFAWIWSHTTRPPNRTVAFIAPVDITGLRSERASVRGADGRHRSAGNVRLLLGKGPSPAGVGCWNDDRYVDCAKSRMAWMPVGGCRGGEGGITHPVPIEDILVLTNGLRILALRIPSKEVVDVQPSGGFYFGAAPLPLGAANRR